MSQLEWVLYTIEKALDTKFKRHIAGGILMSISILFGGLSLTVMSLSSEDLY